MSLHSIIISSAGVPCAACQGLRLCITLQVATSHFPRVERPAVSAQRSGSLGLSAGGGFGLPVTSGGSMWDSGAPGSGGRR